METMKISSTSSRKKVDHSAPQFRWLTLTFTPGGFERWFNLTVVNISEEDADDYTCVGVNAGGVSEQNVSLTFDQPKENG